MTVKCKNCNQFRKHHRPGDERCPTDANVRGETINDWLMTSYELSAESAAKIASDKACRHCEQPKNAHQPVTRNCPNSEGTAWMATTYSPKGYTPVEKHKKAVSSGPVQSELDREIDTRTKLIDVLNTQINSVLTHCPGIEVREVISLEERKSITLIFSHVLSKDARV